MAELLRVERLSIRYGAVEALKGVSLALEEGEIVTVLGANGAGKSTLLRAVSGLLPVHDGEIRYAGGSLARVPPYEIVVRGISHAPEGRKVFATLTVEENLNLGAFTRRRRKAEVEEARERAFSLFPLLKDRRRQLAGTLSGGEQQMLAIGRALMSTPRLLLLDEPSLGLAPDPGQPDLRDHPARSTRRGWPSCWWSRTPTRRWPWRGGATCWRPAASRPRARPRSCAATRASGRPTWAARRCAAADPWRGRREGACPPAAARHPPFRSSHSCRSSTNGGARAPCPGPTASCAFPPAPSPAPAATCRPPAG